MPKIHNNRPMKRATVIWFTLVIVILSAFLFIWLWLSTLESNQDAASETTKNATTLATSTPEVSLAPTMTSAVATTITTQQAESVAAAAKATDTRPVEGVIRQRPDYVSEIEWQSLKLIAERNPNPDQELTRLISNIRFNKQMEIWKSLANSPDTTQRHALANQLLNDIPAAVNNLAIDQSEAQNTQIALLTDLISDSNIRKQRIAQEAARIGVRLNIQESP